MASISKQSTGGWLIQFTVPAVDGRGKKRGTIRTGKCAAKRARSIKWRIEDIVSARARGHALEQETAEWLRKIDNTLHQRIANTGLIQPREQQTAATLGPFLTDYIARRTDVKPATRTIWGHTIRNLKDCFGDDRDIATINAGDAEDFKQFLIHQGLAGATIARRLTLSRQFIDLARKRGIIDRNPFEGVKGNANPNPDKQCFVSREDTERIIAECNPVWRIIVALARYGGLRCPSEVLSLQWEAVNWDSSRITVESPKTEHHGKGSRVIPIFPELRPLLQEAWDAAPGGAVYVVNAPDYRAAAQGPDGWRNSNLRTQFGRILKRAGVAPYPKPFQNLRCSRETELAAEHPIHVVTAWMGNTPKVAMKHYLQVTDGDFEKATGSAAKSAASALQKALRPTSADSRDDPQASPQPLAALRTSAEDGNHRRGAAAPQCGRTKIRTTLETPGENALSWQSAAESAALCKPPDDHLIPPFSSPGAMCQVPAIEDPELREVVDAWGDLPATLRAGILAMIRQSGSGEG